MTAHESDGERVATLLRMTDRERSSE